jgi:monoamine oxidase
VASALVVGAGLAGLAAAGELRRAGVSVRVLEARDRVGGRVHSVPFAGAVVERGAEFVLPGNSLLTATAQRLGLRLVRKGTLYGLREPRGGEAVSLPELAAALERMRSPAPRSAHSVADALDHHGLPRGIAESIRSRIEVSCAHPADDLEAGALAEGAAAFGRFDTHGVEGGNGQLAEALAAELGASVQLSTPVQRVEWAGAEVRLLAAGSELAGDAAVLAIPASVAAAIEFDPPLPRELTSALGGVRYGQAAKLFVALRTPAPPSATLSVPDRYWCYTQLGADGHPLPLVSAFAGTAGALDALEVTRGPERWLAALARLRPELELEPESAIVATWADDAWARGAYSARAASSPLATSALSRPYGRLTFAGEHTAGPWHGLMEGALRSGVRAARDLLGRPPS